MRDDLDKKLKDLKDYSSGKNLKRINQRIYNLDLTDKYLKTLNQDFLSYIHVKLHTSLSFKKPFAPKEKIKKVHDRVAKLMSNHINIDKLDE